MTPNKRRNSSTQSTPRNQQKAPAKWPGLFKKTMRLQLDASAV
jgi:hypothetical protein